MNGLTSFRCGALTTLALTTLPIPTSSKVTKLPSIPETAPLHTEHQKILPKNNSKKINLENTNNAQTDPEEIYTEAQIACAERLSVDISECNPQGVFIGRTFPLNIVILKESTAKNWNEMTPEQLSSITELKVNSKKILSLIKEDLDGLSTNAIACLAKEDKINIFEFKMLQKTNFESHVIKKLRITGAISLLILATLIAIALHKRKYKILFQAERKKYKN